MARTSREIITWGTSPSSSWRTSSAPGPCYLPNTRRPRSYWGNLQTWPDLTWPDLTWPGLTWPDLTWPDLTLPYLTLPYLTLLDLTLPYLTLPYLTLPYLTWDWPISIADIMLRGWGVSQSSSICYGISISCAWTVTWLTLSWVLVKKKMNWEDRLYILAM